MSLVFAKPIAASLLIIDSPSDNQLLRYDSVTGQLQSAPLTYIGDDGYVGLGGEISPATLIEMTHASPYMTFHCDTESDAADSGICKLLFKREQLNGTESTHAAIYAAHDGTSANQRGYLTLNVNGGSDGNSPTERIRINYQGYVGINNNNPNALFHIKDGIIKLEDTATHSYFAWVTGSSRHWIFHDDDWTGFEDHYIMRATYTALDGDLIYFGAPGNQNQNTDGAFIVSDKCIRFGTGSATGTALTNTLIYISQSTGNFGINDAAPAEKLDVDGNTNVTGVYKVADTQVVGAQQAHIADAGVGTEIATINAILAALETHGLLASA